MDGFCEPYWDEETQQWLYGAAAREKRIKELGGVDNIINEAGRVGGEAALEHFMDSIETEKRNNFRLVSE